MKTFGRKPELSFSGETLPTELDRLADLMDHKHIGEPINVHVLLLAQRHCVGVLATITDKEVVINTRTSGSTVPVRIQRSNILTFIHDFSRGHTMAVGSNREEVEGGD